jgi:hypothetical protein
MNSYDQDTPRMGPGRFLILLHTNVDNANLTDKAFREFVRNSLPVVEYERPAFDSIYQHSSLRKAKGVYRLLKKEYPAISFGLSALDDRGLVWVREGLLSPAGITAVSLQAKKLSRRVRA